MTFRAFITALSLSLPLFALAQSQLDRTALAAAEANPATAQAKALVEARRAAVSAENTLQGPEVDFDYKFAPSGEADRWGISVGQGFDWPGVYAARRRAGKLQVNAAEELYRAELADRILEVKTALIDFCDAAERIACLRKAQTNIQRYREIFEKAYANRQATALDMNKFSLQAFALANRIAAEEANLEALRARAVALGCKPGELDALTLPAPEAPEALATYEQLYSASHPALAARTLVEAAEAQAAAARRAALPSFKLAYTHDYEDRTHFNGFSIGIALPSWNPTKAVRASEAEALAASLGADAETITATADIRAAHATASALYARVTEAAGLFDKAEYPALLEKALELRSIDILTFFNEYNAWLDAACEYSTLRADLAKTLARLNRHKPVEWK